MARQEASGERTPLLLLDHGHIYLVLGGIMGLGDIIDRVRRHASQTGEAYLSASDLAAEGLAGGYCIEAGRFGRGFGKEENSE